MSEGAPDRAVRLAPSGSRGSAPAVQTRHVDARTDDDRHGGVAGPAAGPVSGVVAVLLAAGGGSRFEGPTHKLLARLPPHDDRPAQTVVERSLTTAIAAAVGPVVVVTGAADVRDVVDGVGAVRTDGGDPHGAGADHAAAGVHVAHNPDWASGQLSSIRTGLRAAAALGAERVVIGLGDQPGVQPSAWRAVAAASETAPIAVAVYDGRRGNPVALRSEIWHLLPDDGDEGARTLMRLRPDLVVAVPCSGSPDDIDTEEDLRRWQNSSSTNSP